jgi:LAGLIDADG DNA endonuclease family
VSHPWLTELREQFYQNGRKIVPIGLAVWIMDDGAAEGKQLRIDTQGFLAAEAEELCRFLRAKFGIEMTVNRDKAKPRLRCKAASMERLKSIVREHTIPDMLYKLSL